MLVSSSSGTESETGLNERKRIHSDSDSEDNEALWLGPLRSLRSPKPFKSLSLAFSVMVKVKWSILKKEVFFTGAYSLN